MHPGNTDGKFARQYRRITVTGLVLTVAIFIALYFLPEKRLQLVPSEQHVPELYGVADPRHGKSAWWLGKEANHWICDYRETNAYGCGWWTTLNPANTSGIDFSAYDALELDLNYHGPASRLRIFLRQSNPSYTQSEDANSSKVMSMSVSIAETKEPIVVDLDEFSVSRWWLLERKVHRQRMLPEFDAITVVGVDLVEPGVHEVRIDRIALVGQWVKTETLLVSALLFWMTLFLIEGVVRFFQLYRTAKRNRQAIKKLEEKQRALEEENRHLESVANTDPLTGIYNRAGLLTHIEAFQRQWDTLAGFCILLLDIDHFKRLNDRYGHDKGDKVLKTFASLLTINLREDDILARLGGEEFIVISRARSADNLHIFAEKLRQLALHCTFNGDSNLHISVSIGVAVIAENEDFSSALKRADTALYRAKQSGRNRVEHEAKL